MNVGLNPFYLPDGLPAPCVDTEGLSAPYWDGLAQHELRVQRCETCGCWQFGPEHLCHVCHAFDPVWTAVAARGRIFSWERVWHPAHPALAGHGPYLVVLVELTDAGGIRQLGNLLGDPMQPIEIGSEVEGVFEDHGSADPAFTLLHWRAVA